MIRCSKCNEFSIYYEPMSNREYCKKHFCEYFENNVKENMKKLNITRPKIAVYYSGGKDSAVLLYVLRKILKFDTIMITANLGVKEHFEKISKLGEKISKELDIDYFEVSLKQSLGVDIPQIVREKNAKLACHYCGELRNIALDKASYILNVDAVASGHNRDDVTRFLLNNYLKNDIFRTTEFASKIYPEQNIKKKINYINPIQLKPLIYLNEKEITLYCLINNIEITDACCGFGSKERSDMQGWRNDLTYTINFLEEKYPGYSINLIKNFEKNFIPIFNECVKNNINFFKQRQCVFCKRPMNTEIKDICLTCEECAKTIGFDATNNDIKLNKI